MNEILGTVRVSKGSAAGDARKVRKKSQAPPEVAKSVESIVGRVRLQGDRALLSYAKSLDGSDLGRGGLKIPRSKISTAAKAQPRGLLRALQGSLGQIKKVQSSLIRRAAVSIRSEGFEVEVMPRPLPSVGCYVPGGRASYASSVLMTAGVAKLAGVRRVVLCTPAGRDGKVNPAILAAASIAGVDELYRTGGAQAIAAMAYGTESIEKVDKIVGPGGRYVSAAKKLVSRDVSTDFYAGPTEIVVLADESCDPEVAAWELIGQAEHGEDTLCGLVCLSDDFATKVRAHIRKALPKLERREYIAASLRNGFSAVCTDMDAAIKFVNAAAPEHLSVMTRNPERTGRKLSGAGLKLLGRYSPCAASDYLVGTDHVIPTAGLAAARGPLSVLDFVKLEWSVTGSSTGLRRWLPELKQLTDAEGLPNHYLSARARFAE